MKLTGEYEITETGVVIEGKIHDTHIAEVRDRFKNRSRWLVSMFPGNPDDIVRSDENYERHRYKMLGPRWFEQMQDSSNITAKQIAESFDVTPTSERSMASTIFSYAGVAARAEAGSLMRFQTMQYRDAEYRLHSSSCKLMNVGWIYEKVQGDGSFSVQLYGLVNRHIMTMLLQRATRYAKLLDSPKVWELSGVERNLAIRSTY